MTSYLTYENFLTAYPWIVNLLSLTCAYLLSNGKVVYGRLLGAFAAINWMIFGYLSDQYAFLFANIIFFMIYTSAVIKFRSKRDSYKETFAEQEAQIKKLERSLEKKTRAAERTLAARELKIKRNAEKAKACLEALIKLSDSDGEDESKAKSDKAA